MTTFICRAHGRAALTLLSFFLMCSCALAKYHNQASDPLEKDTFSFREPASSDLSKPVLLWATYYYLPEIHAESGTIPIRDMKGSELGPRFSLRDWCDSAMEGSVRVITKNNEAKTYNYAGTSADFPVDCSSVFRIDVSKTKFREAHGPYGDGLDDFILAPYRTLATDSAKIPTGSVVYIPEARGAKITLKNGRVITHDGYFFAGDKGGAIKDSHIDVFIGSHTEAPFFPWIKSNQNKTFRAYLVTDRKIIIDLYELHTLD